MATLPTAVAIIDSDQTMTELVKRGLYKIGISLVKVYSDGNQALQSMKVQKNIGLVLLDWKLKGSKPIAIFQAIRSLPNNVYIPIVVTSGLIAKQDFSVLNQFPCVELLEKPYTKDALEKILRKCWGESLWYEENEKKVSKVFSDLKTNGAEKAKAYLDLVSSCQKPQPLILAASRYLREMNQVDAAAKLLDDGLSRFPNDPSLTSEMGKIYFIKGNLKAAKDCIEKSIDISPENIERLIFAGEINLNLDDPDRAREYFDSALEIDRESEEAKVGNNLIGVLAENKLSKSFARDSVPRNLASLLNLVGISKVRSNDYDDGINQYHLALNLVKTTKDKQKILFNLSLGNLRAGNHDEAENFLKEVIKLGGELADRANYHYEKMSSYRLSSGNNEKMHEEEFYDDYFNVDFDDELLGPNSEIGGYENDMGELQDEFFSSLPKK